MWTTDHRLDTRLGRGAGAGARESLCKMTNGGRPALRQLLLILVCVHGPAPTTAEVQIPQYPLDTSVSSMSTLLWNNPPRRRCRGCSSPAVVGDRRRAKNGRKVRMTDSPETVLHLQVINQAAWYLRHTVRYLLFRVITFNHLLSVRRISITTRYFIILAKIKHFLYLAKQGANICPTIIQQTENYDNNLIFFFRMCTYSPKKPYLEGPRNLLNLTESVSRVLTEVTEVRTEPTWPTSTSVPWTTRQSLPRLCRGPQSGMTPTERFRQRSSPVRKTLNFQCEV